jgi:hypothetical protein
VEGRSPGNHYLPGFFGAPAYLLQYCTRPRFSRVLDLFRGEPARPDPYSGEPGAGKWGRGPLSWKMGGGLTFCEGKYMEKNVHLPVANGRFVSI